jgi:hypothetical protein
MLVAHHPPQPRAHVSGDRRGRRPAPDDRPGHDPQRKEVFILVSRPTARDPASGGGLSPARRGRGRPPQPHRHGTRIWHSTSTLWAPSVPTHYRPVPTGRDGKQRVRTQTPGLGARHLCRRFWRIGPAVIPGNNRSRSLETLGREAVVAAIYHEHNALNWRLAARTTWTCPGPLPAFAAHQL